MAFFSAEAVRDFYFDSKTLRPEIIERADVNYVGSLKPLDLFMLSDGILPGRSRFLKIGDNMFALSRDGSDFVKVSPMNINSQMPSIELTAVDNSQYQVKQTFRYDLPYGKTQEKMLTRQSIVESRVNIADPIETGTNIQGSSSQLITPEGQVLAKFDITPTNVEFRRCVVEEVAGSQTHQQQETVINIVDVSGDCPVLTIQDPVLNRRRVTVALERKGKSGIYRYDVVSARERYSEFGQPELIREIPFANYLVGGQKSLSATGLVNSSLWSRVLEVQDLMLRNLGWLS